MQSTAEDVKDMLLVDSGFGLDFAINLFIDREPATPANCVTIFNSSSFPPALTLGNDVQLYYPSVQILIRNKSQLIGYNQAFQIMQLLHGRGPEIWNGTTYCSIVCVSEPSLLDWDEQGRCHFVLNFNLIRR